ncbi:MAG: PLP-dependent aminotransferase family protein [Clostridia bacterium]|nr:PLP-dependent aminotransferase family protein [Clostridia bacterium]
MPFNSFDDYPMSWRPTLRRAGGPLYLELAELLEQDIRGGRLLPGTRLPPQRELADFLDLNLSTVSRAFKLCAQRGLIAGTVGSGTHVSYDALASLSPLPRADKPALLELGALLPDNRSFVEVTEVLREIAAEPDCGRLFGYDYEAPSLWQREAAARLLERAGCPSSADRLMVSGGAQNALAAILAGLFSPGDRLGVDPLTYPGLKSVARMLGIQLVAVRQERGVMSAAGIAAACRHDRIKGLYLMPTSQDPTTRTMSVQERQELAEAARRHDLLLIEDGIHSLLTPSPLPAIASFAAERTLYLLSLSNTVSPGLRVSYLVVPERYRPPLEDALSNINLTISPLLLEMASRLLASDRALQLLEAHRREAERRNALADHLLAGLTLRGDAQSFYRWLELPKGWTAERFEKSAELAGVAVHGAQRFAVGSAPPPAAARLAVCSPPDLKTLEQALTLLRQVVENG